jgi:hypothetical protein
MCSAGAKAVVKCCMFEAVGVAVAFEDKDVSIQVCYSRFGTLFAALR